MQADLEPESNPESDDMDLEAMAAELAMDTELHDSDAGSARYKAVAQGVIRKEADMDSENVGKLKVGEIILVTETKIMSAGTVRVHFDRGWASLNAKSGKVLLEKLD